MRKNYILWFTGYGVAGLLCLIISIVFIYYTGDEFEKMKDAIQVQVNKTYPLSSGNSSMWGDIPGKMGRTYTKTQYMYFFNATPEEFEDYNLLGISAAVKSPMLTSDRVQYKCTRNAVMAKKQVAKFLVDFNFADYEITQVSPGNDYDRHIPQINLCAQSKWQLQKSKQKFEIAIQGFNRYFSRLQNILVTYIASRNVYEKDFNSGSKKDAIFTGLTEQLSSAQRREIWTDSTYGLENSYSFYKIISNLENGLPTEWSAHFGISSSSTLMQLTSNMALEIGLKLYLEVTRLVSIGCKGSPIIPKDLQAQSYMFAYAQWAFRGYNQDDRMRDLIPSEPFQDVYHDKYILDFYSFWKDYFYYNVRSEYKINGLVIEALEEDLKKGNIFDYNNLDPNIKITNNIFSYEIIKEIFEEGALIENPFYSHSSKTIDYSSLDAVGKKLNMNATTVYAIYRYLDYFTDIVIYQQQTPSPKISQHNQIGLYLSYKMSDLFQGESYHLYMYILGFTSMLNARKGQKDWDYTDCYNLANNILSEAEHFQKTHLIGLMCPSENSYPTLALTSLKGWINWISNLPKFRNKQSIYWLMTAINDNWDPTAGPTPSQDDILYTLASTDMLEGIVSDAEGYIYHNMTGKVKDSCVDIYDKQRCTPFELMYGQMNTFILTQLYNPTVNPAYAPYTADAKYGSIYQWKQMQANMVQSKFEWGYMNVKLPSKPNEQLAAAAFYDRFSCAEYIAQITSGRSGSFESFVTAAPLFRKWLIHVFKQIVIGPYFTYNTPGRLGSGQTRCLRMNTFDPNIGNFQDGNDLSLFPYISVDTNLKSDLGGVPDQFNSILSGMRTPLDIGEYVYYHGSSYIQRAVLIPLNNSDSYMTYQHTNITLNHAHTDLIPGKARTETMNSHYLLDSFLEMPIPLINKTDIITDKTEQEHLTFTYDMEGIFNTDYKGWVETSRVFHFQSYATVSCTNNGGKLPGNITHHTCPDNSTYNSNQTYYNVDPGSGYTLDYEQNYEVYALIEPDAINWDITESILVPILFVHNYLDTSKDKIKKYFYSENMKPHDKHMATQYLLWFSFFFMLLCTIGFRSVLLFVKYKNEQRNLQHNYENLDIVDN